MKTCGPNKVICIDATHGTNGYDFSLITVLVVDEFGEGFPIAWCLSNRTDLDLLTHFFLSIKKRTGNIEPKWVMTDDASQYFLAWINVFGKGPRKLLCTWHVDRAWRGHLNSIRDKEVAQKLYHNLRALMEENDQTKFNDMLNKTIKQMSHSEKTEEFGKYFETFYFQRKDQWASCYRKYSSINTNMYVESFHKVLKHIYLKGKKNKRVDKCIQVLLKYERDKGFDRLIKLEKGKQTRRIRVIKQRHQLSLKLSTAQVDILSDTTWKVKSANSKEEYFVSRQASACPCKCSLKCADCDICIHMYYCNCMDATINHTICKHIHLVATCNNKQIEPQNNPVRFSSQSSSPPQLECSLLNSLCSDKQDTLSKVKQRLRNKLSLLQSEISECEDIHALLAAEKCLSSASSACKVVSPCKFRTPTKKVPPNKNITPQRPFASTKKKCRKPTIRFAKPSREEKNLVFIGLVNQSLYDPDKQALLRKMLGWFCDQLTMVDRMLKGHVVSVMDLHDDALPDEVLDCNLSILKSFFDDEAWDQVLERVAHKQEDWKCGACTVITAIRNMILCDDCLTWFHWSCVEVNEEPEGNWFCTSCLHTKRTHISEQ